MTIKIVTDSSADLTKEEVEKYGIRVIPLQIAYNGKSYLDQVDITSAELLEEMDKHKHLPVTSQPSVETFTQVYDELTSDGSEVISIHLAAPLSGTVNTAFMVAGQYDGKVTIIDSAFISRALAFQVIAAAEMAQAGKTVEEITARLKDIRGKTKLYVILDTLENLVKGGRIGKGKALIGSLMNIKPVAELKDGEYTPLAKARSHKRAIKQLIEHVKVETGGKAVKAMEIVQADGLDLASRLKEKLKDLDPRMDVPVTETTPVISIHTGRGAAGLMFYTG